VGGVSERYKKRNPAHLILVNWPGKNSSSGWGVFLYVAYDEFNDLIRRWAMTYIENKKLSRIHLLARAVLTPVLLIALLFLLAGRLDYWQAWVYLMLNTLMLAMMATLFTKDAGLIEERLNPKQGIKSWDRVYFAITTPLYFVALIVAGLDARFGWSSAMPAYVYWSSVALYLIGQAIFIWARYANRYFSSVVRIQTDRGQTVCKEGPYRLVRHPGYLGGFLFTAAMGPMLGSWWAFIPQLIAALMLIWRTALEDRTLQAELPGYQDYVRETHYRLLPGIW
jgi:protein-S-isoprenylcysteine O-methyltransferase Ste14